MSDAPVPVKFGSWDDAEALRRWSFQRRSPEQRLAWLIAALKIAYGSGALRALGPPAPMQPAPMQPAPTQAEPGLAR
jgi:hypothetical protein